MEQEKKNYNDLNAITAWDEGEDIKVMCKDKDGKRGVKTIKGFEWYFVIEKTASEKPVVESLLNRYYGYGVVIKLQEYDDKFIKVFAKRSVTWADVKGKTGKTSAVKDLLIELQTEGVTLYESDLSKYKRFMIDNFASVCSDLDILYFDIETDDTAQGIEIGRDTILSWAACDQKGNIWFEHGDEKELLKKFLNLVHEHDIITGWNSGNFDLPYIQSRMDKYGLTYEWKKKMHIDLMQRCVKVYSYGMFNIGLKGFALNEVARVFLGESKVFHEEGIKEMHDNNFELFKKYNIKDVTLLRDLDTKLMIIDLMIKECSWTGSFLDRFYIGELLDNYILRRTRELKTFQHARPDWNVTQQRQNIKIRGGYVMTPVEGLHKNVRTLDFKSLYPSIVVGWNIGQDVLATDISDAGFVAMCNFLKQGTPAIRKIESVDYVEWRDFLRSEKKRLDPKNEYIQAANNVYFKRHTESFIGGLVTHLLDLRQKWRDQAKQYEPGSPEFINFNQSQGMVKEMANSMYGITADKASRYFNQHVAEAITLTGQFLNRTASHFAEVRGYPTIYGDSVIGSTNVKFNKRDYTMDSLWSRYSALAETYGDKEIIDFDKLKTKTMTLALKSDSRYQVWAHASKLIRHKTNKQLYKITTESGKSVTVTEDHSLIVVRDGSRIVIKPTELLTTDKVYCKTYHSTSDASHLADVRWQKGQVATNNGESRDWAPITAFNKGMIDWSNGLTSQTDARVKKRGKSVSCSLLDYYDGNDEARDRVRRNRLKQTFGKSKTNKLEAYFEKALKNSSVTYSAQEQVERYCTPDFIIKDKKIAIFCDGDYWHANPLLYTSHDAIQTRNLEIDARQSAQLVSNGWVVRRYYEKDIYENVDKIISELEHHYGN